MKTGLTVSALVHGALLLWGLISFSARPLEAAPTDALPVDIISDKQFSEMTKGVKNAPKEAKPAPLVEKVGDPKPVEDSTAKINEKKELKASKADVEPPPPPPEPKTEPKPDPKPKPKPPEAKPEQKPPPKVDPIAETLKKEEAKKQAEEKAKAQQEKAKKLAEEKAKQEKAKEEAKRNQQPKFDPNKIAALLDKREPQRQASVGQTLVPVPGLGTPTGSAAKLSQSEIDALRARLMQLWNVPAGVQNPDELKVTILVTIGRDRKLSGPPRVLTSGRGPMFTAARDSAVRALFMSQPFDMLRPDHYEQWKEIEITFDPRYMYGGG
jgi:colicin import membrane protein